MKNKTLKELKEDLEILEYQLTEAEDELEHYVSFVEDGHKKPEFPKVEQRVRDLKYDIKVLEEKIRDMRK